MSSIVLSLSYVIVDVSKPGCVCVTLAHVLQGEQSGKNMSPDWFRIDVFRIAYKESNSMTVHQIPTVEDSSLGRLFDRILNMAISPSQQPHYVSNVC